MNRFGSKFLDMKQREGRTADAVELTKLVEKSLRIDQNVAGSVKARPGFQKHSCSYSTYPHRLSIKHGLLDRVRDGGHHLPNLVSIGHTCIDFIANGRIDFVNTDAETPATRPSGSFALAIQAEGGGWFASTPISRPAHRSGDFVRARPASHAMTRKTGTAPPHRALSKTRRTHPAHPPGGCDGSSLANCLGNAARRFRWFVGPWQNMVNRRTSPATQRPHDHAVRQLLGTWRQKKPKHWTPGRVDG